MLLTSFLSVLAMWASWPITKNVRAYCVLFLLLETGMLGVFLSLDFFLFYVFWEVMLLPMYFLIGIWGGPRREYAAIKFFLFTLVGSVLMLVAILMLYFNSDLQDLTGDQLVRCSVVSQPAEAQTVLQLEPEQHTFNILALAELGQLPDSPFHQTLLWGQVAVVVGVCAAADRFHHQAAVGAVPHLAARRPRRGPHAHLDDPGWRAVENGRLRRDPHLLSDLSRRRLRPGLVRLRTGHGSAWSTVRWPPWPKRISSG